MKENEKKAPKQKKEPKEKIQETVESTMNNTQYNQNYQPNYSQYGPMNYTNHPNNNQVNYNQPNYNNQMNYTPTYNIDNTYVDKEALTQTNISNLLKFTNIYKIALIVIAVLIFLYFAIIEALSTGEGWIMVLIVEGIAIINGTIVLYFLEWQTVTLYQIKEIKDELKLNQDKKRK